jgi:2-polyprenyl-6-methoxyphenol hydroxylase-like FAD-dependent oxidoreductase
MYPVGSNGGSQAIIDASVLARSLADEGAVAKGPGAKGPGALAAYEAARLPAVSKIVLANRSMPVDAVLDMVAARAPDGFDRIEDVLDAGELGTLRDAYRATSQEDVAALNSRPPILPVPPRIPQT